MKHSHILAISLAMLLLVATLSWSAPTFNMAYPPPGGVTLTSSGNSIASGGATFAYSGFNTAAFQTLYYGVNAVANVAQSDVLNPGNMAFNSYNSSTGIITFVSTQNWVFSSPINGTVSTPTQLLVQLQPFTGTNSGFLGSGFLNGATTTKGTLGINTGGASDPLFQVVGGTAYQATFEFETWDGTPGGIDNGTDVADFYAANHGGSNSSVVNTSIDFEFWYTVQKTTAKSVQVGTCKTNLSYYGSIQAAVSAVPSGATILVCPGTYSEQVNITAPVNVQGVANGPIESVILAVPAAGLEQNGTGPVSTFPIFAQVLVQDAASVSLSGLTIDGNSAHCPSGAAVGVAVLSAVNPSSAKLTNSVIRNTGGCAAAAAGFYSENGSGSASTLTVQGNSVHSINGVGIIFGPNTSGSISTNAISQTSGGIMLQNAGPNLKVAANNINSSQNGISLQGATGTTVQTNTIINSANNAVSLNENSGGGNNNVTKNTINEGNCGVSKGNAASSDVFLPNVILNVGATTCP